MDDCAFPCVRDVLAGVGVVSHSFSDPFLCQFPCSRNFHVFSLALWLKWPELFYAW